jgi:hypothetical protein
MSVLAAASKLRRDRWARRITGIFFAVALSAALHAAALPPALLDYTDKYCSSCHNDEDKKGRLDLTSLTLDLTATTDFSTWVKVHDRLGAGEMPPKEKKRPDAAETAAFLAALRETLGAHDRELIAREGRATQRRLNGYEYENALRDLLHAPWLQIRGQFPDDGESNRYNKIGDALDVSHVHLARYMAAADYAIRQALTVQLEHPPTTTVRPRGRGGRWRGTLWSGSTACKAASSKPRRHWRPVAGDREAGSKTVMGWGARGRVLLLAGAARDAAPCPWWSWAAGR